MPDGGRVFDQKGEAVQVQQRQSAAHIGAERVAHAGVEAIVDMGENQVQIGVDAARLFDFGEPFRLHAAGEPGAKIQKASAGRRRCGDRERARADRCRSLPEFLRGRRAFMGVKRAGLAAPSSDSK